LLPTLERNIIPNHYNTAFWVGFRLGEFLIHRYVFNTSNIVIYFDLGWLAELMLQGMSQRLTVNFEPDCLPEVVTRGARVLRVLLRNPKMKDWRITEEVVTNAATAEHRKGELAMKVLLEQRHEEVRITEDALVVAAANCIRGKEILELLLDQCDHQVHITEKVLEAAAGNLSHGREILGLILARPGEEVEVTENVLKEAAARR